SVVARACCLLVLAVLAPTSVVVAVLRSEVPDHARRVAARGLTGPAARADAAPVAGRLEALREVSPEALRAYVALARLTADRALAAGILDPPAAQRLLDVLAGAPR